MVFIKLSLLNSSSLGSRGNFVSSSNRDSTNEGTNNRGVVDDVVGGVGGGVLLDSDLGDMVDLVMDLVANMVDNRGSGNMDSRGSNMVSSRSYSNSGSNSHGRGSLDLNSLYLSNCRGGNMVGSRGNS